MVVFIQPTTVRLLSGTMVLYHLQQHKQGRQLVAGAHGKGGLAVIGAASEGEVAAVVDNIVRQGS